jgi:hypothetical protein
VLVGFVMGGIQSLSRSTYAKLMPETKDTTSFFSFYDVTEKIAIVIGMFSFGYINELERFTKKFCTGACCFLCDWVDLIDLCIEEPEKTLLKYKRLFLSDWFLSVKLCALCVSVLKKISKRRIQHREHRVSQRLPGNLE